MHLNKVFEPRACAIKSWSLKTDCHPRFVLRRHFLFSNSNTSFGFRGSSLSLCLSGFTAWRCSFCRVLRIFPISQQHFVVLFCDRALFRLVLFAYREGWVGNSTSLSWLPIGVGTLHNHCYPISRFEFSLLLGPYNFYGSNEETFKYKRFVLSGWARSQLLRLCNCVDVIGKFDVHHYLALKG